MFNKLNLINISLILGITGCISVIISFLYQLNKIYKENNADGTSWGLIIS